MAEQNNFLQGKEAKAQTFTASRGGAYQFNAMKQQVETDYKKDKLASQYQQGVIDEDKYMKGLQGMLKQMREGSTAEKEVESSIIGVAQEKYQKYTEEEQKKIQAMTSQVDLNWLQKQRDYKEGKISTAEFKDEQMRYEEYHTGLANLDLEEFTFDRFRPGGAKEDITPREKAVGELYKKVLGRDVDKAGKAEYITGKYKYAPLPWLEKTLELSPEKREKTGAYYSYGKSRSLKAEQESLTNLVSKLGKIPNADEINAIVYGGYPIEAVKAGNFSKSKGYYE